MPAVVRETVRLGQLCSTTMRSVYARDEAPCSDAFHPERWSNPPPVGLAPIVPCDDPDEEDAPEQASPRPASEPAPPLVVAPEPEPLTQRWEPKPPAPGPAVDEPIILPFRDRSPDAGSKLLLWAAVSSGVALLSLVAAVLVWA